MEVRFGNLSVEQIERKLGINFNKKEKEFLNSTRCEVVSELDSKTWHCYDLPFIIECGGDILNQVSDILKKYSSKMNKRIYVEEVIKLENKESEGN